MHSLFMSNFLSVTGATIDRIQLRVGEKLFILLATIFRYMSLNRLGLKLYTSLFSNLALSDNELVSMILKSLGGQQCQKLSKGRKTYLLIIVYGISNRAINISSEIYNTRTTNDSYLTYDSLA